MLLHPLLWIINWGLILQTRTESQLRGHSVSSPPLPQLFQLLSGFLFGFFLLLFSVQQLKEKPEDKSITYPNRKCLIAKTRWWCWWFHLNLEDNDDLKCHQTWTQICAIQVIIVVYVWGLQFSLSNETSSIRHYWEQILNRFGRSTFVWWSCWQFNLCLHSSKLINIRYKNIILSFVHSQSFFVWNFYIESYLVLWCQGRLFVYIVYFTWTNYLLILDKKMIVKLPVLWWHLIPEKNYALLFWKKFWKKKKNLTKALFFSQKFRTFFRNLRHTLVHHFFFRNFVFSKNFSFFCQNLQHR